MRISALDLKDSTSGSEPMYKFVRFRFVSVVGIGVIDTLKELHTLLGDPGSPARTLACNSDVSIVCQSPGGYPMRVTFKDTARTAVINPFQDFGL